MASHEKAGRRHDLDLLRVLCFGTLILYHTSLIFGTRSWLIHTPTGNRLMDLVSVGSHPWRMSLLFFISGFLTSAHQASRTANEIRAIRTRQLLVPFIGGVLLIVPPQIYFSHVNPFPMLGYPEFWMAYITSGISVEHLWFLSYLWLYILIWSVTSPWLNQRKFSISAAFSSHLQGCWLYVAPIAFLSLLRLCLYPVFGETLVITNDVYAHILYFSMFMAGVLLMSEASFWQEVDRQRWHSCALAAVSFMVMGLAIVLLPREQWPDWLVVAFRFTRSMFQWSAMLTLLAFAKRAGSNRNRVVAYFNSSIMTYYVAHQTLIVVIAYCFMRKGLLGGWSFLPISVATMLACIALSEALKSLTRYGRLLTKRNDLETPKREAAQLPAYLSEYH